MSTHLQLKESNDSLNSIIESLKHLETDITESIENTKVSKKLKDKIIKMQIENKQREMNVSSKIHSTEVKVLNEKRQLMSLDRSIKQKNVIINRCLQYGSPDNWPSDNNTNDFLEKMKRRQIMAGLLKSNKENKSEISNQMNDIMLDMYEKKEIMFQTENKSSLLNIKNVVWVGSIVAGVFIGFAVVPIVTGTTVFGFSISGIGIFQFCLETAFGMFTTPDQEKWNDFETLAKKNVGKFLESKQVQIGLKVYALINEFAEDYEHGGFNYAAKEAGKEAIKFSMEIGFGFLIAENGTLFIECLGPWFEAGAKTFGLSEFTKILSDNLGETITSLSELEKTFKKRLGFTDDNNIVLGYIQPGMSTFYTRMGNVATKAGDFATESGTMVYGKAGEIYENCMPFQGTVNVLSEKSFDYIFGYKSKTADGVESRVGGLISRSGASLAHQIIGTNLQAMPFLEKSQQKQNYEAHKKAQKERAKQMAEFEKKLRIANEGPGLVDSMQEYYTNIINHIHNLKKSDSKVNKLLGCLAICLTAQFISNYMVFEAISQTGEFTSARLDNILPIIPWFGFSENTVRDYFDTLHNTRDEKGNIIRKSSFLSYIETQYLYPYVTELVTGLFPLKEMMEYIYFDVLKCSREESQAYANMTFYGKITNLFTINTVIYLSGIAVNVANQDIVRGVLEGSKQSLIAFEQKIQDNRYSQAIYVNNPNLDIDARIGPIEMLGSVFSRDINNEGVIEGIITFKSRIFENTREENQMDDEKIKLERQIRRDDYYIKKYGSKESNVQYNNNKEIWKPDDPKTKDENLKKYVKSKNNKKQAEKSIETIKEVTKKRDAFKKETYSEQKNIKQMWKKKVEAELKNDKDLQKMLTEVSGFSLDLQKELDGLLNPRFNYDIDDKAMKEAITKIKASINSTFDAKQKEEKKNREYLLESINREGSKAVGENEFKEFDLSDFKNISLDGLYNLSETIYKINNYENVKEGYEKNKVLYEKYKGMFKTDNLDTKIDKTIDFITKGQKGVNQDNNKAEIKRLLSDNVSKYALNRFIRRTNINNLYDSMKFVNMTLFNTFKKNSNTFKKNSNSLKNNEIKTITDYYISTLSYKENEKYNVLKGQINIYRADNCNNSHGCLFDMDLDNPTAILNLQDLEDIRDGIKLAVELDTQKGIIDDMKLAMQTSFTYADMSKYNAELASYDKNIKLAAKFQNNPFLNSNKNKYSDIYEGHRQNHLHSSGQWLQDRQQQASDDTVVIKDKLTAAINSGDTRQIQIALHEANQHNQMYSGSNIWQASTNPATSKLNDNALTAGVRVKAAQRAQAAATKAKAAATKTKAAAATKAKAAAAAAQQAAATAQDAAAQEAAAAAVAAAAAQDAAADAAILSADEDIKLANAQEKQAAAEKTAAKNAAALAKQGIVPTTTDVYEEKLMRRREKEAEAAADQAAVAAQQAAAAADSAVDAEKLANERKAEQIFNAAEARIKADLEMVDAKMADVLQQEKRWSATFTSVEGTFSNMTYQLKARENALQEELKELKNLMNASPDKLLENPVKWQTSSAPEVKDDLSQKYDKLVTHMENNRNALYDIYENMPSEQKKKLLGEGADQLTDKEEKINKVLEFTRKEKLKEASDYKSKLTPAQKDELNTRKQQKQAEITGLLTELRNQLGQDITEDEVLDLVIQEDIQTEITIGLGCGKENPPPPNCSPALRKWPMEGQFNKLIQIIENGLDLSMKETEMYDNVRARANKLQADATRAASRAALGIVGSPGAVAVYDFLNTGYDIANDAIPIIERFEYTLADATGYMNAVKLATDGNELAADAERLLITAYESTGEAKKMAETYKTTIGPLIGRDTTSVPVPSTTKPESFIGTQSIDNFDLNQKLMASVLDGSFKNDVHDIKKLAEDTTQSYKEAATQFKEDGKYKKSFDSLRTNFDNMASIVSKSNKYWKENVSDVTDTFRKDTEDEFLKRKDEFLKRMKDTMPNDMDYADWSKKMDEKVGSFVNEYSDDMKKLKLAYMQEEQGVDGFAIVDAKKDIELFKKKVSKLFPDSGDSFYKDTAMFYLERKSAERTKMGIVLRNLDLRTLVETTASAGAEAVSTATNLGDLYKESQSTIIDMQKMYSDTAGIAARNSLKQIIELDKRISNSEQAHDKEKNSKTRERHFEILLGPVRGKIAARLSVKSNQENPATPDISYRILFSGTFHRLCHEYETGNNKDEDTFTKLIENISNQGGVINDEIKYMFGQTGLIKREVTEKHTSIEELKYIKQYMTVNKLKEDDFNEVSDNVRDIAYEFTITTPFGIRRRKRWQVETGVNNKWANFRDWIKDNHQDSVNSFAVTSSLDEWFQKKGLNNDIDKTNDIDEIIKKQQKRLDELEETDLPLPLRTGFNFKRDSNLYKTDTEKENNKSLFQYMFQYTVQGFGYKELAQHSNPELIWDIIYFTDKNILVSDFTADGRSFQINPIITDKNDDTAHTARNEFIRELYAETHKDASSSSNPATAGPAPASNP